MCVHTPPCVYVPHSIYTKPPIFVHTPLRTCLAHCSPVYPIVRMYTPLCVCILHCLPVYPTVCVYSPPCVPACFVYPNCHLFTACINPILEASSASTGTWTRGLMRRLGSMAGESQSRTPLLRPSGCSIDSKHQAMSFTYTRAIVHSSSLSVG